MGILKQFLNKFQILEPKTHEIFIDGVTAFIPVVKDGGERITISGWRYDHYKFHEGDMAVILKEGKCYHYKIKEIRRMSDPEDQYFMDCEWASKEKR